LGFERYTRDYAKKMDETDRLNAYRKEFYLINEKIYMDGNSLGLLSKRAEQSILDILTSWKEYGIDGWTNGKHPWFYLSETLSQKLAPLVGANEDEVIITGSTTVNLHQLLSTFYRPTGKKTKILADELNFPSDIYALKSHVKLHNLDVEEHLVQVKSKDGRLLEENDLIHAMTDDVSLIVLPSVLYRSGQILDMEKLTFEAHRRGIFIGFDLCHSIGAIPHELHQWGVDFAFWCNYKYLNGGPGSVGGLFVHEKHFGIEPGLAGWFSSKKEKQFDMEHSLDFVENARAFQIGTPHILSIAPLIGSLNMFLEVGIETIREKSLRLTNYMMELIQHELPNEGFFIGNPMKDDQRGGHVYLEHSEAARITKALKDEGVIPDFRSPNGIRLAPVALYNTYEEVYETIQILKKVMVEKRYLKYENKRGVVA